MIGEIDNVTTRLKRYLSEVVEAPKVEAPKKKKKKSGDAFGEDTRQPLSEYTDRSGEQLDENDPGF